MLFILFIIFILVPFITLFISGWFVYLFVALLNWCLPDIDDPDEDDDPDEFVSQNMKVAILKRDDGESFYTLANVNNTTIEFLVDTGASKVALSLEDARQIGFDTSKLKFCVTVNTANGDMKVAEIVINSIRIKEIEVFNIPAYVMPRNDGSLLGLSFLSELYSYEFGSRSLIMKQQILSS